MTDDRQRTDRSGQQPVALSTRDDESNAQPSAAPLSTSIPDLTNTELVQLRIRVIALENLLISMLSHAPDHELKTAEQLASHIRPRPGSTLHPLTISAADHMKDILNRAAHLRTLPEVQDSRG